MMTKMQPEKNTFPPIHVIYPFSCDDVDIAPSDSPNNEAWGFQVEAGSVKSRKPAGDTLPSPSGMPLWPSLTEIRATMGEHYPWKNEMDRALAVRSALICAAVIGMCALGLLLTV